MSAQDEVPVVVKCLRLGAADYLVKPLRTNELLNLWTHAEKKAHGLFYMTLCSYAFFAHNLEHVHIKLIVTNKCWEFLFTQQMQRAGVILYGTDRK
jgi:DNA-binding response OmpR family regulator